MKPGKKSSASLQVATPFPLNARPSAPADLSVSEAALWGEIVASLPADWFRPSDLPILAAYCQAASQHEKATKELSESTLLLGRGDRVYRNPLIAVQHAAALRMGSLASKMRLCQSARYDKNKAAGAVGGANSPGGKSAANVTPPWLEKAKG